MLRLLAPGALVAATVASVLITSLHFLSVRRPPLLLLPTARFLGPNDVRAVSRNRKPSDLLLLLLRVLALLAIGLALSSPTFDSVSSSFANVIVADASWRSDSARLREIAGIDKDSDVEAVFTDSMGGMQAQLGAAWPEAWRAAATLLDDAPDIDSVGLHIFAPRAGVESYAAWHSWRLSWPGNVTVHTGMSDETRSSVGLATSPLDSGISRSPESAAAVQNATRIAASRIEVSGGPADDVVRVAFDMYGRNSSSVVLVDRSDKPVSEKPVDKLPLQAQSGANTVRINWPQSGVPLGWTPVIEPAGALVVAGNALVANWNRTSRAPNISTNARTVDVNNAGNGGAAAASSARVIARWNDGTPAAIEHAVTPDGGCIRDVGVLAPQNGDVMISQRARALISMLTSPCGTTLQPIPASVSADSGGPVNTALVRDLKDVIVRKQSLSPPWLPAALLALALALLGVEQLMRRGVDR